MIETLVCNQLIRKGHDLYYWKDDKEREVDFVVCDGLKPKSLVQVCENIDNEKAWKRETESLIAAAESLAVSDLYILTHHSLSPQPVTGIHIEPVLNWFMEK